MLNRIKNVVLATTLFMVAACGSFRDTMGLRSNAPDEFRIVSSAPLVVPPEFNLRPPAPGAKRPQEVDLQRQAKDILFETKSGNGSLVESKGESAFLKRADASDSDQEIKEVLIKEEQDAISIKQKKGFFEKAASYASFDKSKEPIVNAGKEKERIAGNKKEGKPANEGSVAVIEEGKGGLLNNVFGF